MLNQVTEVYRCAVLSLFTVMELLASATMYARLEIPHCEINPLYNTVYCRVYMQNICWRATGLISCDQIQELYLEKFRLNV